MLCSRTRVNWYKDQTEMRTGEEALQLGGANTKKDIHEEHQVRQEELTNTTNHSPEGKTRDVRDMENTSLPKT